MGLFQCFVIIISLVVVEVLSESLGSGPRLRPHFSLNRVILLNQMKRNSRNSPSRSSWYSPLLTVNSRGSIDVFFEMEVGHLGSGKTSIIQRFVSDRFSKRYKPTMGVDFALRVRCSDLF